MERRDILTDLELKSTWARSDWAEAGQTHLERSMLNPTPLERASVDHPPQAQTQAGTHLTRDRLNQERIALDRLELVRLNALRVEPTRAKALRSDPAGAKALRVKPARTNAQRSTLQRNAMERAEAEWAGNAWARAADAGSIAGGNWPLGYSGGQSTGADPYQPASYAHVWLAGLVTIGLWPFYLLEWLYHRHLRNKQRQHLQKMPDHMLKDIGLTRGDLYSAFGKPTRR